MRTVAAKRRRMAFLKRVGLAILAVTVFTPKFDIADWELPFVSAAVAAPLSETYGR